MTGKPFISARIPEELLDQLESRVDATGESKSHVLVEALTEYLNPEKSSNEDISGLEKRFRGFEHWVAARLSRIEDKVDLMETSIRLEPSRRNIPTFGEGGKAKSLPAAKDRSMIDTPFLTT